MGAPPLAPPYAVDREALRRKLDNACVTPLTLLVAPAGAGKSVLLAQWAATHPELSFVWLEVVEDDDDPVRFSQRLLRGIGAINSDFADLSGPDLAAWRRARYAAAGSSRGPNGRPAARWSSFLTTSTTFQMPHLSPIWVASSTFFHPMFIWCCPAEPISQLPGAVTDWTRN